MLIDITSNVDEAVREWTVIERSQVPFGTSLALNATIRDVRRHIVGVTYPKSFEVRNRAFPNTAFRMEFSRKNDLNVTLYDRLAREFLVRHAEGGIKVSASGGRLAIPLNVQRTGGGRIPAGKKPRRLTQKKSTRVVRGSTGNELIVERFKGQTIVRYVLANSAKIDKRFRFYEDCMKVAERVIEGHWNAGMVRALSGTRVFSAG